MQKFFLYARKSTDEEERQIRSIEDQIAELRDFAEKENLEIIDELIEKQSAKIPGRPIFNEMIKRIEKDEAQGILSWHPDRLARNSVDGGKIIYLVDCGHLQALKFSTFWFEPTPQGKFMLNIAFGQSKYYVDSLSENTKRGQRQKAKRGEYPGLAPVGYINDARIKSIVVHKKRSVIIRKAFELYAKNESRLEDISNFLAQNGILSKTGKRIHKDRVSFILQNPFYVGLFRYTKEIYEGKHQPIISKKIFDKVQEILKQRGKIRKSSKNQPQAFCGLLRCGTCGMMITAESRIKKQKNGNVHHYVYYRCSRKSKTIKCAEPPVRQEILEKQISSLLQKFSLKQEWVEQLNKIIEKDKTETAQSFTAFVQGAQEKIKNISAKIQRLLDSYLDQVVEREIYLAKKSELVSEKKSLEEKINTLEQKRFGWVEPMQNWINYAQTIAKTANESSLLNKKAATKEIFGLNLVLANREARRSAPSGTNSPSQKHWAAISAAHDFVGKKEKSFIVARAGGFEPPISSVTGTRDKPGYAMPACAGGGDRTHETYRL